MNTVAGHRAARRVALLRGINLGASRRLPMAWLREVAERLGWADVATHLQSGNLIFRADGTDAEVAAALSAGLEKTYGMQVGVVVRGEAELRKLVEEHPFGSSDPSRSVIVCCDRPVGELAPRRLADLASGGERVELAPTGADLYADFPDGQAGSRLAAGLVSALRPANATARNLRTMRKLADLLADPSAQ